MSALPLGTHVVVQHSCWVCVNVYPNPAHQPAPLKGRVVDVLADGAHVVVALDAPWLCPDCREREDVLAHASVQHVQRLSAIDRLGELV